MRRAGANGSAHGCAAACFARPASCGAPERIVHAFRGQGHVEELFRRLKKGGVVPWGPSSQWADASLQLPTFAIVLGLTLVALAKLALGTKQSAPAFMQDLANINATLVRTKIGLQGRRPTVMVPPELSPAQQKAGRLLELDRWLPSLYSTMNELPPLEMRIIPTIGRKSGKSG